MSDGVSTTTERLNLGIAAARAGHKSKAQSYLTGVLRQDPHNIPAMLWLAFVLPAPQDRLRLLERVLELDPDNERAKAGIRWVQGHLEAAALTGEAQPLTKPVKKPAQPSPPARSAAQAQTAPSRRRPRPAKVSSPTGPRTAPPRKRRRLVWSKAILALSVGTLSVAALILAVLVVVPLDALAAWRPLLTGVVPRPPESQSAVVFVEASPEADTSAPVFASAADTVLQQNIAGASELILSPEMEAAIREANASPAAGVETENPSIDLADPTDPTLLIGPELVSPDPQPGENLLLVHQSAHPAEKWIEVNVSTQQITAWEGTTPIFSFTGSTGLPNTPTVLGKYNIYWKLESTLMVGPNYYLPEVPHTMYFYRGYALHGAYWHNNFGQPMSHGCVNLTLGDAEMLFDWADPVLPPGQTQVTASADNPGTLVVVHD